jgi:hypothetical protein
MADDFVYRADPPGRLAGAGDIAARARLQEQAGLNVVTPGEPVTADEIRRGPHEATGRLSAELALLRSAVSAPVKLCLPLPGTLNLDPMLLQGLIGNLIDEGATILQLDGAAYADPDLDAGNDGFTLMGLPRPEGFRLAIDMGPLAAWEADRLSDVAGELAADRYVFAIAEDDDLGKLAAVPEDALVVLGVVDPQGGQTDDAILSLIDAAVEVVDQDRLALTVRGGFDGQDAETQAKVLRQVADVSVQFWGFAM